MMCLNSTCRRLAALCSLAALLALPYPTHGQSGDDPWPGIREALFQARPINDGATSLQIFAPNQADDAALVPISVRMPANIAAKASKLTLIIDRNPAPVAGTFIFGDAFRASPDVGERSIATRVRVDAFSRVRAVLELADGTLEMASKFVIGAGGCSAPATKDPDEALASLGRTQMKLMKSAAHDAHWREIQVMIKHPNFTGMQMDKKTGSFTPAVFVNSIDVRQGTAPILRIEGGISLSEDPNIRFTTGVAEDAGLEFGATDTAGRTFYAAAVPDPS
ncbi:MAG: quinoprotein dehydrogenase-associated SoxYZ-like carrier [Hyphomicrobium sp.]|jgi:sulfur-oxidizing protein SoxY